MFGTIRVNGEDLPLTKRGRLIVDVLSGVGAGLLVYGLVVIAALVGG
jgi:hypothetical protein